MKDGEYKCFECNGSGLVGKYTSKNDFFDKCLVKCSKCNGAGKLDWINNIITSQKDNSSKWYFEYLFKPSQPAKFINLDFVIKREQKKSEK